MGGPAFIVGDVAVQRVRNRVHNHMRFLEWLAAVSFMLRTGYRREGDTLVPDDHEQGVIAQIRENLARGASLRSIVHELNAAREAPHRGNQWYTRSVAAVLKSRVATETA